ncbi:uncharacterized protein LOC128558047 [Mercenaria mercenaria]|uniref:uncharacterized protein LOC128558047 n=1 Tax=Mercenaria mercenaria TaxID=6596 RepID=UPI00234E3F32|nr:uncharacterized protein LOC128558047 [Mercenaria mercenaria]
MHLNIQSLKPKIDILEIEAQPYDILIFTKSWLSPAISNDDLLIPNFQTTFRCDRNDRIGGGVTIYIRDGLLAKHRDDLSVAGIEALWLEINFRHRVILVGGIYRPPDSNNQQWLLLEQSIDQAFNQPCDNILVAGDFNINILNTQTNKISNLISSYQAEQLISSPTHFTENSSSLIDLIFVKNNNHVLTSFVADPFIPDMIRFHCPIVAVLKLDKPINTTFKRKVWLYDKGNYDQYKTILHNTTWDTIIENTDLNKATEDITHAILTAAQQSIPNKTVTIRPNDIPWLNNTIRKAIRKRKKLHKTAKRLNTEQAWTMFKTIRNEVTKLIRISKQNYQNKLIEQVNSNTITAKLWFKTAKKLTNKTTAQTIPTLQDQNTQASTDQEKTELLNHFFAHNPP